MADRLQWLSAKLNGVDVSAGVKASMRGMFRSGDTIKVHVRVKEGEKERLQIFQGVVIKVQGRGPQASFTVRKMSGGIGVERTFPMATPAIDKVDVVARGKVRRSRLFFLRGLRGKAARLKSELVSPGQDSQKKAKGKVPPSKSGEGESAVESSEK